MNKNTMYIVVAVVVVIIVIAGVAAYIFLYSGGEEGNGGNGNGGGETIYTMGNATSLQFGVLSMIDDSTTSLDFAAKNLDNMDLMLRVDLDIGGGMVLSYIMYGNQTSFNNESGEWMETDFATDWENWNTNQFSSYRNHNPDWTTGMDDIEYTDDLGNSITIYDIVINPSLDDSLFTVPST